MLDDGRVVERAPVHAVAVGRDAADRRPGLGQDAVLGVTPASRGLREVRVHLDLVDGGNDIGVRSSVVEVLGHEVADADRADLAVGEQCLERLVRLDRSVELAGSGWCRINRSMWSTPSLRGALLEAVQRLVVAVVADPDLRLDEDLVAGDA